MFFSRASGQSPGSMPRSSRICRKLDWGSVLQRRGARVVDHGAVPVAQVAAEGDNKASVAAASGVDLNAAAMVCAGADWIEHVPRCGVWAKLLALLRTYTTPGAVALSVAVAEPLLQRAAEPGVHEEPKIYPSLKLPTKGTRSLHSQPLRHERRPIPGTGNRKDEVPLEVSRGRGESYWGMKLPE